MSKQRKGMMMAVAGIVGVAGAANASIINTGLAAIEFTPASVVLGAQTSDVQIIAFDEQAAADCVLLDAPLHTDQGWLPAGLEVKSHFIHSDAVVQLLLDGRVRFDTPIIAVISTAADLDASDPILGNPAVTYPAAGTEPFRGYEIGVQADLYQVIAAGFGIQVRTEIPPSSYSDHLRVVNSCD